MRLSTILPVLLLTALLAAPLTAQEDTVEFNDPNQKPVVGRVSDMNYRQVRVEIPVSGSRIPQTYDSPDIKTITLHSNNKGYELNRGEGRLRAGQYKEAIEALRNVERSPTITKPAKQFAHYYMIQAYMMMDDDAGAARAVAAFRREYPDTFFLRWTYETLYQIHRRKRNTSEMKRVVDEFRSKANSLNFAPWKKSAEIMQAELHEFQNEWSAALAIHRRYASDKDVGDSALLGELRCLSNMKDTNALRSKAESIIRKEQEKAKKQEQPNMRLLMGAYNGRGDAYFLQNDAKKAMLDYLRVVVVLGPRSGEASPEHEAGIGKAAIAAAKFASAQKERQKKEDYKARAESLLKELVRSYGGGSAWVSDVQSALESVK